jgi:hypothetical protein
MVATTEGDANRKQVLKLIEEKENIEKKISEFGEILKKVKIILIKLNSNKHF